MTIIYKKNLPGPAAHALVIGVGYYHHLPGGKGKQFSQPEGLTQLSSPPHSARAFADWLLKTYHNPERPLGTVDLLLSEPDESSYALPEGTVKSIKRAKFNQVKQALLDWKARGDTHPDHLMILFFCGHGVARSFATSLLMEDFGKDEHNPLDTALSFHEFFWGMDTCQARQQVYFIDACRSASPGLITRYNNFTGHAVIPGANIGSGSRVAPIYYSTIAGASAYGRENQTSVYTEGLLKCFNGASSSDLDEPNVWRVDAESIPKSLNFIQRRILGASSGLSQVLSTSGELGPIVLHVLKDEPVVPVTVTLKPKGANSFTKLGYNRTGSGLEVFRPQEEDEEWDLDLAMGDYRFFAQVSGGGFHDKDQEELIEPPYRVIPLEVDK